MAKLDNRQLVLGVDGGNATTNYVLTDQDQLFLAALETDTVNINRLGGIDNAGRRIMESVKVLMQRAGLPEDTRPDVAVLGLSGIYTDQEIADMHKKLRILVDYPGKLHVFNDSILPLSEIPGKTGIVLVVGGGQITNGRNSQGMTDRVGGHGVRHDEGGGIWLANQVLERLSRNDGRLKPSFEHVFENAMYGAIKDSVRLQIEQGYLSQRDPEELAFSSYEQLYPLLYQQDDYPAEVVMRLHNIIVPRLMDLAQQGQSEALAIVDRGAYELADQVRALAGKLDMDGFVLVGSGSVINNRQFYRRLIESHLADMSVTINGHIQVSDSPVVAALRYGRQELRQQ